MPVFIHPRLRALDEARELTGTIKVVNSAAVTLFLNQEAQGQRIKVVPKVTFSFSAPKAVRYTAA